MARVSIPALPDDNEAVTEIIGRACKSFERKAKRRKAEKWLPITLDESGPFVVNFFGDPHKDDENCNWPLLLEHIALCNRPHVYGACVGDKTNNWVGRLVREYADQNVTRIDARRLAQWYMKESGVNWLFHVLGNHDAWNEGAAILGLLSDDAYYFPNWEARVEIVAAGCK